MTETNKIKILLKKNLTMIQPFQCQRHEIVRTGPATTVDGMTLHTGHKKNQGKVTRSTTAITCLSYPGVPDTNLGQSPLPGLDKPLFSLYLVMYR